MKMYKEVLIESEEQARALPPGTLVYSPFEPDPPRKEPIGFRWAIFYVKYGNHWSELEYPEASYPNSEMVGEVALVEVGEEEV